MNENAPACFGKHWDKDSAECAGGNDPLFYDPDNKNHKRERCAWFRSCSERVNVSEYKVIPANHLTRPFTAPSFQLPPTPTAQQVQAPPWSAMAQAMRSIGSVPQVPTAQRQPSVQVPVQQPQQNHFQQHMVPQYPPVPYAPSMVHPSMATLPHYVPMNYGMPGAQVPGFLTVPEAPDQPWKSRLAYSIFRGLVKAFGMVLANFFDHTPISPRAQWHQPPPQGPTNNQ